MGFMSPDRPEMTTPKAPDEPTPAQAPKGERPKRKSMQTTFLGADMAASPGTFGSKTLIGQ